LSKAEENTSLFKRKRSFWDVFPHATASVKYPSLISFQEQISMTKTRRTRQQWQQLINEQPDSGLTIHDYCQQQHLNVSGFYLWRKKLAAESENVSAADWLSLPAADLPGHTGDWQIELLLPGGVTLRMNSIA
jgi:hypothetical protein